MSSAVVKYKLGELAKDLAVSSKEIIALLQDAYGGEAKKTQTSLTENELDYVFEHYTKNSNNDFAKFFQLGDQEKAERENPKPAPVKEEPKPKAKPEVKEKKPEPKKAEEKKPEVKKETVKKAEEKPVKKEAPVSQQGKPFQKNKKENVVHTRTEKVVRIVDTRTSNVDMSKYDDRIDSLIPQNVKDYRARKQKIGGKKKQNGKFTPKVETEAEKLQRLALEKARKAQLKITIPDEIVVSELASRMKKTSSEVVKKLMLMGMMANQNEVIDFDTAGLVCEEFNIKYEKEITVTIEEQLIDDSVDAEENLEPRDPVVTVMGHVDHGKTSLLDAIRHAHVTSGEAGGITQHIGAYKVKINDSNITFIDTPGHAAFTEMRARGANITDIVVLVVAADDGIMPQTVEAFNHAQAANVAIIVAINKMDKPTANPDRVKQELTEHGIVPEEWGGDVPCVPVSALTNQGITDLLEMITLTAEMLELKANPNRHAKGTVIEAKLDKGRGPVATLLVQNGTLNSGDVIIAGTSVGRVRAMTDENARKLATAGPSTPVEIIGLAEVPAAGDVFYAVENEKMARELADQRREKEREEANKSKYAVSLDGLFAQIEQGNMKELNIIIKADVQGTAEALKASLQKLSNEEVAVKVIHQGVGAINDSDIMLASASGAIIVGFNVRPDVITATNAKNAGVDIRTYSIIYECIEEMEQAMKGMLAPKYREVVTGFAEVRMVYKISSVGTVAGCMVKDGKITRNSNVRVLRDSIVIADTKIEGLRRFKDDVKEVAEGYECGISIEKFNDIKEGDIFEAYIMEEYRD